MAFSKNVLRAICILIMGLASIKSQTSYTGTEIHASASTASQTSSVSTTGTPSNDPLKGFKIVCLFNNMKYYKEGFTPAMIDPTLCTHVNYEFAILDDMTYELMTGEPDLDVHENFYQEAVDLKKKNPNLKVMLSLGGWGDSTKKYSDLVASSSRRKNFIKNAVEFIKAHGFDGIDVSWQYPNCWQGAIGVHPDDKENFAKFLQELRKACDQADLTLSVSVGAIKREVEAAYDIPAISKAVHHINLMTYDMHGPWEGKTGHHAQFDKTPSDADPYANVKSAVQIWISGGVDKKKLILGIPLYGNTFTLVDPKKHGIKSPAKGPGKPGPRSKQGGFIAYNEMCEFLNAGNWTEEEDKIVGFYSHNGDQWSCYDPPMMVVRKAKYVVESGLGGVLLKDLSTDDFEGNCFHMPFPLTKMARMEIIHKVKRL